MKKLISIIMCISMIIGITVIGMTQSFAYKRGDYILYGSYPQSRVTDTAIISALEKIGGEWQSYGYYSGNGSYGSMKPSDFMRYRDVTYKGEKYRAVTFDTCRPDFTYDITAEVCASYQDWNGYTPHNVYWFKYEPIKWKILDPDSGLVMSESILDSQAFNNYMENGGYHESGSEIFWGDADKTYYACDYEHSSIREWLNGTFYQTSFDSAQQDNIALTTNTNKGHSTIIEDYGYEYLDFADTTDKIWLLSFDDVVNEDYGFSSDCDKWDSVRLARGTDYAKCQGLYNVNMQGSVYDGCSRWRLRSAGDDIQWSCMVNEYGGADALYEINNSDDGIRPVMRLKELKDSVAEINDDPSSNLEEAALIRNNPSGKKRTCDYKTTVTFTANTSEGDSVQWYIDSEPEGSDKTLTVKSRTESYKIMVVVISSDGSRTYDTETVTIKNRFIDKLVWFILHFFVPDRFNINQ